MNSMKQKSQVPLEPQMKYSTILRIISGQECEPQFVLVEHSYAKPWINFCDSAKSHPRKTLFLRKISKLESEEIIDVTSETSQPSRLAYDEARGRHLMSECERHVDFAKMSRFGSSGMREESGNVDLDQIDWEEMVNKSGWTDGQNQLFSEAVKILDSHQLARLALKDTENEPVKRRAQIDKAAARFRKCLGRLNWDMKMAQWLHTILIQSMNNAYLAAYLDILQTLKSKIPYLIDKMMQMPAQRGPNAEALNLLLKRPWDPAVSSLNQEKPTKLESAPIVIQVPSGSASHHVSPTSRRIRFFNSQLQHLAKFVPVSISSESGTAQGILDQMTQEVLKRVSECKASHPSSPIILLGWGIGAVLACFVSMHEKVSAVVCLGFPMVDHMGKRGEADDPLLDMKTPALFVVGDGATNASVDDVEDFRTRIDAETSLVVLSGADLMLRMCLERRYQDGLTQSMVDRCIVDEIGDFLRNVLNENPKPEASRSTSSSSQLSASSSQADESSSIQATSSGPSKSNKKEISFAKKRKSVQLLSESSSQKVVRISGNSTISGKLGLKIPLMSSTKSDVTSSSSGGELEYPKESIPSSKLSKALLEHRTRPHKSNVSLSKSNTTQNSFANLSSASTSVIDVSSFPHSSDDNLGLASIPLGSIASITRQKHLRMMELSESIPDPLSGVSSSSRMNLKSQGIEETDIDVSSIDPIVMGSSGGLIECSTNDIMSRGTTSLGSEKSFSEIYRNRKIARTNRRGRPPGRPKGSVNRAKDETLAPRVPRPFGQSLERIGTDSSTGHASTTTKGSSSAIRVYASNFSGLSSMSTSNQSFATSLGSDIIETSVETVIPSTSPEPSVEKSRLAISASNLLSKDAKGGGAVSELSLTSTGVVNVNTEATSGQTLTLQGISTSRSVLFTSPTSISTLPLRTFSGPIVAVSGEVVPKTTKSIVEPKAVSCITEEVEVSKPVDVEIESSQNLRSGAEDTKSSSLATDSTLQFSQISSTKEDLALNSYTIKPLAKSQSKALILGTKFVSTSKDLPKQNLTLISSRDLTKALSSTSELSTRSPSKRSVLKVPLDSLRLVKSVPSSPPLMIKSTSSNVPVTTLQKIITKSFTINKDFSTKTPSVKRRASVDASSQGVSKRIRTITNESTEEVDVVGLEDQSNVDLSSPASPDDKSHSIKIDTSQEKKDEIEILPVSTKTDIKIRTKENEQKKIPDKSYSLTQTKIQQDRPVVCGMTRDFLKSKAVSSVLKLANIPQGSKTKDDSKESKDKTLGEGKHLTDEPSSDKPLILESKSVTLQKFESDESIQGSSQSLKDNSEGLKIVRIGSISSQLFDWNSENSSEFEQPASSEKSSTTPKSKSEKNKEVPDTKLEEESPKTVQLSETDSPSLEKEIETKKSPEEHNTDPTATKSSVVHEKTNTSAINKYVSEGEKHKMKDLAAKAVKKNIIKLKSSAAVKSSKSTQRGTHESREKESSRKNQSEDATQKSSKDKPRRSSIMVSDDTSDSSDSANRITRASSKTLRKRLRSSL